MTAVLGGEARRINQRKLLCRGKTFVRSPCRHVIGVSAGYAHAACWTADGLGWVAVECNANRPCICVGPKRMWRSWRRKTESNDGIKVGVFLIQSPRTTGGRMIEQPVEMKLPEGIVVCEAGCSKGQVHHHTTLRTSDGLYAAGDGYKVGSR